ncbi:DUF6884 domain-containing protein [Burkholderia gladioli]|uniref:DUF6884 domain-containing protein n=1 Tax=Burkholderia gladioli TaxID=28095 RepID=UPI003709C472
MTLYNQTAERLVVLACSARKLAHAAPAIELYRGVMYSTYRANVHAETAPAMMILSARHGFIRPDTVRAAHDGSDRGVRKRDAGGLAGRRADHLARRREKLSARDAGRARAPGRMRNRPSRREGRRDERLTGLPAPAAIGIPSRGVSAGANEPWRPCWWRYGGPPAGQPSVLALGV